MLLLGIEHSKYYGLRGVGALLWELIQTPRQVRELCETVQTRYDIGAAQLSDVVYLLNDLIAHGLATVVES